MATGGLAGAKGWYLYGINSHENVICYNITLEGFRGNYSSPAVTATRIHEAPKGMAGPRGFVCRLILHNLATYLNSSSTLQLLWPDPRLLTCRE